MAGFEALCFSDARDIAFRCLCLVAGPAEDLKVLWFVRSPKCEGKNVINVPGFAGVDLLINIFGIMVFLRRCVRCKKLEDLLLCVFTKNIQSSLSGLIIFNPTKSFSLFVTMTQSFARATDAMIMSNPSRGQIGRAHV